MSATPGDRLRMARVQAGLEQKDLAEAIGVSQNAISLWENNRRRIPSGKLGLIAEQLHVTADFLLGLDTSDRIGPAKRTNDHTRTIDWPAIATIISRERQQHAWTVNEVATQVHTTPETWQEWEAGEKPIPLDAMDRIARVFQIPLAKLLVQVPSRAGRHTLDRRLRDLLPIREVPILGRIVAGIPLETQPDLRGSAFVSENTPGNFALEVHGDSMSEAGIHEGDLVIAQRIETWEDVPPNSMVVALVGGETTLKYLIRETDPMAGDRWWLRAANPAYPDRPIDPGQDRVQGVVTSIQTVRPPIAPTRQTSPLSNQNALGSAKDVFRVRGPELAFALGLGPWVEKHGHTVDSVPLDYAVRPSMPDIARVLEVSEGTPALYRVRLQRLDDDIPIRWIASWMPADLFERIADTRPQDQSLFEVFEAKTGVHLTKVTERLLIVPAKDTPAGDFLKLTESDVSILIERIVRTDIGRVAEYAVIYAVPAYWELFYEYPAGRVRAEEGWTSGHTVRTIPQPASETPPHNREV